MMEKFNPERLKRIRWKLGQKTTRPELLTSALLRRLPVVKCGFRRQPGDLGTTA